MKKSVTITKAFQEILDESRRKPNKIWVDKGNEFCNRSMKSQVQDNGIKMYSAGNKGKFVFFLKDLLEPSRIRFANI